LQPVSKGIYGTVLRTLMGMMLVGWIMVAMVQPSSVSAAEIRHEHLPVWHKDWTDLQYLPDGAHKIDRELHRQREYQRRWHEVHDLLGGQHISHRAHDLLRGRGLGPALVDKDGRLPGSERSFDGVDTLRVLIVRIAFDENRDPHLTTVDPSGDFVLEAPTVTDTLYVDPPPRNKAFYESHLLGLSEFYSYQSGGRLHIQGRVLPDGAEDSYKLTDIADYGPGAGGFWTTESLERLVRDMIVTADEGTQSDGSGVNLANFDDNNPFTYIIFVHAGSDWQSDINQDSPNDIPTFFVTLGEPQDLIGVGDDTGLPGQLSECSVIPETTNSDGYPGSIAAAFYHEFGHALGLPDIYNTGNGLPSVGIWDLMDSGTNLPVLMGYINAENDTIGVAATGVLPPSLSAWDKWFLGWLEMGEVTGGSSDLKLPAVQVPRQQYELHNAIGDFDLAYPQALRAGGSSREYFLIENRWVPLSVADTPYSDLRFERDENTGVILYLAGEYGVNWVNSGYYDYFMPAGGVLVWHVNADRIESGLENNTVNWYRDGVILVEADGIQDIGVLDAYVLGWYGSWRDPFGEDSGFRDLYTDGFPNSRCFDRSWTGLSLSDVRSSSVRNASVMRFTANFDSFVEGFPWEIAPVDSAGAAAAGGEAGARGIAPASATTVDLDGESVLIFGDLPPDSWQGDDFPASLYGLNTDGTPRWAAPDGRPAGAFLELDAPLAGPPVRYGASNEMVYWGTRAGTVGLVELPPTGEPVLQWSTQVGDSLVAGPLLLRVSPLCAVAPDSLVLLYPTGSVNGSAMHLAGGPIVTMRTLFLGQGGGDIEAKAAVFSRDGWSLVSTGSGGLEPDPPFHSYAAQTTTTAMDGEPVLQVAAVRHDAGYELFVFDVDGEVGHWTVDLDSQVMAWGKTLAVNSQVVCEPAVADLDGDGSHDLVLATDERILALRPDGTPLRGFPSRLSELFPLPDTTAVAGPLIVADATGDGVNEVFFSTDGGHLLGLDASGRRLHGTPLRWGDRRPAGLAIGNGIDSGGERAMWMLSAGGYAGPPLDRQWVNGRVIGYHLGAVAPAENRTSEWLGAMGGAERRGPAGPARAIGAKAPALAELDQALLYPNPLQGEELTVRFYSHDAQPARFALYTLEGEEILDQEIPVSAGVVNEYRVSLPGIVSGMYVARIQRQTTGGMETKVMTLAVER